MTGARGRRAVIVLTVLVVASTLAAPALAAVDLQGSGSGGSASPGDTVQVSFTVTNHGDSDATAAVLEIDSIPPGWSINSTGGDGTWSPSAREFLYFDAPAAGSSVTSTLTLSVPDDAVGGSYTVSADVRRADNLVVDSADATVTVTGGTSREIVLDEEITSGKTFLQGQELFFDGSAVIEGMGPAARTFQLRRVSDDDVGGLIREIVVGENGTRHIETDDLEGFVVLTYRHDVVEVGEGGEATATLDPPNETHVARGEWEVAVQTLSAEFDDGDVQQGETATLELDSNRDTYLLNVSSPGLDAADLEAVLNQSADGNEVVGIDDSDDVAVVEPDDDAIEFNFSAFDTPGEYTFDLEITDLSTTASASLEVREFDVDVEFTDFVFAQEQGDEAEIRLDVQDTREAWLFVGGEGANYLERVEVVDRSRDGEVVVEFNTWTAGRAPADSPARFEGRRTFEATSDNDTVRAVTRVHGDRAASDEGLFLRGLDVERRLDGPLDRGVYPLRVSTTADVEANGTLPDETDEAVLRLTKPRREGIDTLVAPVGGEDTDDFGDLLDQATRGDRVALTDRLIVEVRASGLYGFLENGTARSLFREGVSLAIEQVDAPANERTTRFDLRGEGAELYTVPGRDRLYVVIDMRPIDPERADRSIEAGGTYNATFSVAGEDEADDPDDSYPYIAADRGDELSTAFDVTEADAELTGLVGDTLYLRPRSDATVRGTTTLAPGTELRVRLRSTDTPAFLRTEEVTVSGKGRFAATVDLSGVDPPAAFEASVHRGGRRLGDRVDGEVVDALPTPTPVTTDASNRTVTVTRTVVPDTATPRERTVVRTRERTVVITREVTAIRSRAVVRTPTDTGGQPGFGAVVALVALAVLALRRRGS